MPNEPTPAGGTPAPASGGGTPAPGTVPTPPGSAAAQPFDLSKVGDEDFSKVFDDPRLFKHPRFKDLTDSAQEYKKYKAEQAAAEENKLKEQKKFEELAQRKDAELNELKGKMEATTKRSLAQVELTKQGVTGAQLEAALKLVDLGKFQIDDTGKLTGGTEHITELLTTYPFLKGTVVPGAVGGGTNPSNPGTPTKQFTLSQLQDVAFYQANQKEIQAAMRIPGAIVDDMAK